MSVEMIFTASSLLVLAVANAIQAYFQSVTARETKQTNRAVNHQIGPGRVMTIYELAAQQADRMHAMDEKIGLLSEVLAEHDAWEKDLRSGKYKSEDVGQIPTDEPKPEE